MKCDLAAIGLLLCVAVTGGAQTPRKLSRAEVLSAVSAKVNPEYPQMARQLKIEGPVELEAVVSETGQVESVSIVSGNPVLTKPAAEAVRKWKFIPQMQDGKPARVIAPISLSFKL
jgi:TonB family protein